MINKKHKNGGRQNIAPTPTTISIPNQSSNAAKRPSLSRFSRQISNGSARDESDKEIRDLDEITQKMGELWYPASVQDLSQQLGRDKYGRLVQVSEEKDGNCSSSHSEASSKHTDWYDKVISSAHCVAANRFGTIDEAKVYAQNDRKLAKSVDLIKHMNKVWAKELFEMDAVERESVLNEMHGIKSKRTIEETAESINEAVVTFRSFLETNIDKELDNRDSIVPPVTKDPYRRAVYELNSDYITSKAFLIKFLRACHYDFEGAALRYFRYLDLLHLLFGDKSLMRPLEMGDLTKREIRYLRKGQMQLFPSRDRAGRRIYAFSGCDDVDFNIREKYRVNIYLIDVLSDDVPTQKLGAVSVNAPRVRYDIGDNPFNFEGMTLRSGKQDLLGGKCTEPQFFRKINEAVPIRLSGIHYFAPNTIIYDIGRTMILSLLGKDHRKIVRFHAGSQLECEYSLRSFGVPHEEMTITEGNNVKNKNVQKFMNARRSIEMFRQKQRERQENMKQQSKSEKDASSSANNSYDDLEACPGIECPERNCVVFGDKSLNSLPANVEFRELLKLMEREREEAVNGSNGKPMPIKQFIEIIIEKARSYNLRFLVFDKNSSLFVDIEDHTELCKRVSQSLRDQRKRTKQVSKGTGQKQMREQGDVGHSTSHGDVLDEAGASIMSLGATKRLKRSYERDANVAQYLFCSDKELSLTQENNGSILK